MSKDVEKKKNYERILIEESLKKVGVSATILDQPGPPQPDAIIQINGDQIGLEHTDLFKSENIQALQKFAYKVIDYASECYQGPASSIYPSFETGKTKEKPEDIGQKLAAFVAVASDGIHHNPVWGGKPLPQIKQIRISRYPKELALVQSAWRPELPLRHDGIIEALKKRIYQPHSERCRRCRHRGPWASGGGSIARHDGGADYFLGAYDTGDDPRLPYCG